MENQPNNDLLELKPVEAPPIPKDFHTKLRNRFLAALKEEVKDLKKNSVCLFKGIPTVHKNYDDIDYKVEQESTFWYFFGIQEADCYGAIEVDTGKATLFIPRLDESYKMWMTVYSPAELKLKHDINEVDYVDSI